MNEGLVVMVSIRALINLDPILVSRAQGGTNPQRTVRIWRTGVSSGASRCGRSNTTRTGWVGATL